MLFTIPVDPTIWKYALILLSQCAIFSGFPSYISGGSIFIVGQGGHGGVTDRFRLGWNRYRDHPELTPRTSDLSDPETWHRIRFGPSSTHVVHEVQRI